MPFKKYIALLLAFFLLISSSGLALNVHYCGGKIASVSTAFSQEEVCEMKVEETKGCCPQLENSHKKCCSDKKVNLENDTEKIVIKSISFAIDAPFILNEWKLFSFGEIKFQRQSQSTDYYCDAHAPPLYQLYSQYIFYA